MGKNHPLIYTPTKVIKPEDITIDTLRSLGSDSFAMWCQTTGVEVDSNPVDFENHRYLLPIYLDNSQHIVWQKAAQLGATVYMLLRILWWLENNQGRKAGLYFPTQEGASNLSSDRLDPIIESCPPIQAIHDAASKLSLRKLGKSSFYIYHLGGVASKDSVPLDFIAFDEVRLCSPKDIDQALERISHSPYKYKIFMSTCFSGDTSVIVREKDTHFITKKTFKELLGVYDQYQILSYNRIGGYRPRWRDIKNVVNTGSKRMSNVTLEGGYKIRCTADHEFAAFGPSLPIFGEKNFTQIQDIPTSKSAHQPPLEGVLSLNKIPEIQNGKYQEYWVEAPYDLLTFKLFGAYISEGTYNKHGTMSIWQNNTTEDNKLLRGIIEHWAEQNGFEYLSDDKKVSVSGLTRRPDIHELLIECGQSSYSKVIPESLLKGSSIQLKALLEGFILGDGHSRCPTPKSNTSYTLFTSSPELASQLAFISLKIGAPVSSWSIRDRINQEVIINGEKTGETRHKANQMSYNPSAHRSSIERAPGLGGLGVRSCEDSGLYEDAYDLTVDEDSWFFLAESGALVHNCGLPNTDVNARFLNGTQHVWLSRCGCKSDGGCDLARTFPECVVEDKTRNKLYLRCPKCGYIIKDPQNGRFVAHNPGADYNSYHVSQLVSKFITVKDIWTMYKNTTNMQEFFNAKLGVPFIDEENRGVGADELESCVNPDLPWAEHSSSRTAMGVDQGGGYVMAVIADYNKDNTKKRIRHIEIIERHNPAYFRNGRQSSPFIRLRELMKEYNVGICVVDGMPNYDEALAFAQDFPGKVFTGWYAKDQKDVVQWGDKAKAKETIRKSGKMFKFKYHVIMNRYTSMSASLGVFRTGDIEVPNPDALVAVCKDESTGQLVPQAVCRDRFFAHLQRLVKQFHMTNEETGEGKWRWIFAGSDPHLAHAWNYCNVALDRLRKKANWSFL